MPNDDSSFTDATLLDRRQFVGLIGAGGLGLLFGPTLEQLARWLTPAPSAAAFNLPADWFVKLGQPLRGYAAFLGGLQLKHLTVRQIVEPHLKERDGVWSGIPPTRLWMKMRPTLLVADEVAARLGERVETVISAYRSPAYNARCPGASRDSQHMHNVALDLQFASPPHRVTKIARELRDNGGFRGGIGLYRDFTHVDTRGTNATWG